MALKKKMGEKRSSPLSDSQNDVVEESECDSASESDMSSPKPCRASVKRTPDMPQKPDPKASRKRACGKNNKRKVRVLSEEDSSSGSDKSCPEPIQASPDPKASSKKRRASDKGGLNRVWSEEDEVALLHGMIQFCLDNKDPLSDCQAFHHFLTHSIHVDVSVEHLKDKITHLKDKYSAKLHQGQQPDENLFKLVWGGQNAAGPNKPQNGPSDFKQMFPFVTQVWESDVDFPRPFKTFQLSASHKIRALEKECKAVFVKQTHLYLNKLDFKAKLAKLVMDQMISADP